MTPEEFLGAFLRSNPLPMTRLLTSLIVRVDDLDATTWQGETPSARDGASHSGLFQIAVKLKITPNQRGGVFCLASVVGETGTPGSD